MSNEYSKDMEFDIKLNPVLDSGALNRIIEKIQDNNGYKIVVDLDAENPNINKQLNKQISSMFNKFFKERQNNQKALSALGDIDILGINDDNLEAQSEKIKRIAKGAFASINSMVAIKRKIISVLSIQGYNTNTDSAIAEALHSIGLDSDSITAINTLNKDIKRYGQIVTQFKKSYNEVVKEINPKDFRQYMLPSKYGDTERPEKVAIRSEFNLLKKNLEEIGTLIDTKSSSGSLNVAEMKLGEMKEFVNEYRKYAEYAAEIQGPDYRELLSESYTTDGARLFDDIKSFMNQYEDLYNIIQRKQEKITKETQKQMQNRQTSDKVKASPDLNKSELEISNQELEKSNNEKSEQISKLQNEIKNKEKTIKDLEEKNTKSDSVEIIDKQLNATAENKVLEQKEENLQKEEKLLKRQEAIKRVKNEAKQRNNKSSINDTATNNTDDIINESESGNNIVINDFTISDSAIVNLQKKIEKIPNIIATISDFEISKTAKENLKSKTQQIENISSSINSDEASKGSLNTTITGLSDIKEKIQEAVNTLEIKTIVPSQSALDNFKKELAGVHIEISDVDYSTAAKNFKTKKEKNPLKISATISSFKIGKGAIPNLKKNIVKRLSNIDIKFKYNLDFIVDEKTKQAVQNQLSGITKEYNDSANKLKNLRENAKSLSERFNSKKSKGKKGGYVATIEDDNIESSLEKIREAIDVLSNPGLNAGEDEIRDYINSVDQIADEFKKVKTSAETAFKNIDDFLTAKNAEKVQNSLEKRWNDTYASVQKYLTSNPRIKDNITLYKQYEDILNTFNNIKPSSDVLSKVTKDFSQLKSTVREAGIEGQTFGQKFKGMFEKFGTWGIVTRIMMTAYRIAGRLFTATKDVDTSMVNLRKVSNETEEAYTRFLKNAGKEAKNLGTTITELTEATATFSRLGYGLDDASQLGEVATMYSKVAENLSPEDASNSIVSTMKAFRMTAEDAESIIDRFNYVGNNFAISSADIGAALQRSAASLSVAGNSLDESIALITAAQSVAQNAESVGKAYCRQ